MSKGLGSGDPNDIVVLLLQLRKIGIMDALSVRDATDILSLGEDTMKRWVDKLVAKGWVRVFAAGGENYLELTEAIVKKTETVKAEESVVSAKPAEAQLQAPAKVDEKASTPALNVHNFAERHKKLISLLASLPSATPSKLAKLTSRSLSNVSFELSELMDKGFLTREKEGRTYRYKLKGEFRKL
jgi:DNA-binding MarR family transcriptional regulator